MRKTKKEEQKKGKRNKKEWKERKSFVKEIIKLDKHTNKDEGRNLKTVLIA